MSFTHPILAWVALGAIPVLALFLTWSWRERRRLVGLFVPARLQASLSVGTTPARAVTRAVLVIAIVSTLLFALARPRQAGAPVELSQRGLDIVLAIDTSRSMLAEDAGPDLSRLQQARLAALDLARLAKTDRIGLVAFAGSAFLQCPLTADVDAFRQSAEAIDTEVIPLGGTSFAAAITTAVEAFRNSPENVRVLILLSDGENHEAGALEAARRAARQDVRIFTLGIGTPEGELIRLRDNQGNFTYLKDEQGNVVKSALNESLLRELASTGNGLYLPLQGPRTIEELYQRGLAPLPRADLDARVFDQYRELYQWPLALALLLLAIEGLLPERPRSRGTLRASATRHPTLATTLTPLLFALCLLPLTLPAASPSQALRLFESGDYPAAEQAYENLAKDHPEDPRYPFNAGTSAYRAGAFDRALQHFNESLRSPDLQFQHDAFYNLGNAHYHAGAQAPDPQARRQHWQNSLQSYQNALRLQTNSPNAQHNLQFVQQQLEALQNPPPQPDQQPQDPQDQEDQEDQEENSQQSQPQPSDESPPPEDQPPPPSESQEDQESQDAPPQPQPPQPGDHQESPEAPPSPSDPGENEPPPPSADGTDPGEDPSDSNPADPSDLEPPKDMTREQALRLLDAARGEEKTTPLDQRRARNRPLKDW
jgi:Ca-activated chloride channel family protein